MNGSAFPVRYLRLLIAASALLTVGCAHSPPDDPRDPLESWNRKVYGFNETVDRYTLRPVAKAYKGYTPSLVQRGVGNFFDNLRYPITVVNSYLQGKLVDGTSDLARFLVNSTIGVAGLFDVATPMGLEKHDEDFGQTLGVWGVGQGIYIVLPLLGPSTGRDLVGQGADEFLDPLNLIEDDDVRLALWVLYLTDRRAGVLAYERLVRDSFDPYLFVRTAYLENRLKKVHDGNPPQQSLDEEP